MPDSSADSPYSPPKVWQWARPSGGAFANINRPVAGATHEKELPVGRHPLQLYSQGTPNGVKVTILLEELLALGHRGAEYDAWLIRIQEGDQFGSGFVRVNPNSKIPALMDRSAAEPIRVFESGAMLLYLAEKTGRFIPAGVRGRAEVLQWLFWQVGGLGPMAGQNGHFTVYAPEKVPYAIERYVKETNRLYGVLDKRLAEREFIAGEYSIADMACYPWIVPHEPHGQNLDDFPNLKRWFETIKARPATIRASIGICAIARRSCPPRPCNHSFRQAPHHSISPSAFCPRHGQHLRPASGRKRRRAPHGSWSLRNPLSRLRRGGPWGRAAAP